MDISIDSNVEFEMVKLPSKGECYVSKITELPVAYLTASDENIITSATLINNRTMCDVLLNKKIVDKSFDINKLCIADRSAILLWLRMNGYGNVYSYINSEGKIVEVDLSTVIFTDFNEKGDEKGHFKLSSKSGYNLIYRLLTHKDENEILSYIEEYNKNILNSEKEVTEKEYYINVTRKLLSYHIVFIEGYGKNVKKCLNNMDFKTLKTISEEIKSLTPNVVCDFEINEYLFNDIIGI